MSACWLVGIGARKHRCRRPYYVPYACSRPYQYRYWQFYAPICYPLQVVCLVEQVVPPDLGELGNAGAPARDNLLKRGLLLDLLPEGWRACENVDRHLVVLVFVRRIAPGEAIGRRGVAFAEERHTGLHRWEFFAARDMDLAAAAGHAGVLLESRLEGHRAEADAF